MYVCVYTDIYVYNRERPSFTVASHFPSYITLVSVSDPDSTV